MKIKIVYIAFLLFSIQTVAQPDLGVKHTISNRILILASPHLAPHADSFESENLDSLIKILAKWKPDHVAVEVQPPFTLHIQNGHPSNYKEVIQYFAQDIIEIGETVQENLFGSWEVADTLYAQISHSTSKDRKQPEHPLQLIQSALGSYRFYTALLQWKKLKTKERDMLGLPKEIKNILTDYLTNPDERIQLGVRLAYILEHQHVHQVDDHMDKDLYLKFAAQLAKELRETDAYKKVNTSLFYTKMQDSLKSALEAGELLPFYQFVNSDWYQEKDVQLQWELFLNTNLPSKLDRKRLALWEVRNLNIASNIGRLAASYPGEKILVIIGSSHKYFLEKYLKEMMGVKLIQLNELTSK